MHRSTSPPQNPRVYILHSKPITQLLYYHSGLGSSLFYTGGVSVSYVLTISPTPLSGSPVTVDTTSTQITISYNTSYDMTTKAVNCVGMSEEISIVDLSKPFHWECHHWLYLTATYVYSFLIINAVVCPTLSTTAAGVWPSPTHLDPVTIYWWIHAHLHLQWRQWSENLNLWQ